MAVSAAGDTSGKSGKSSLVQSLCFSDWFFGHLDPPRKQIGTGSFEHNYTGFHGWCDRYCWYEQVSIPQTNPGSHPLCSLCFRYWSETFRETRKKTSNTQTTLELNSWTQKTSRDYATETDSSIDNAKFVFVKRNQSGHQNHPTKKKNQQQHRNWVIELVKTDTLTTKTLEGKQSETGPWMYKDFQGLCANG